MTLNITLGSLFEALASDLELESCDLAYLLRRIAHEGLAFCTKTLPRFAKAILKGIALGRFPKEELTDFAWKRGLPRFLRGYSLMIFDATGDLRNNPDPFGLWVIRQVCEYCYKLCLPFDDKTLDSAEAAFIAADEEVALSPVDWPHVEKMRKNIEFNYKFPDVHDVLADNRPRRGPGTFSSDGPRSVSQHIYKWCRDVVSSVPRKYAGIAGYFKAYPSSPQKVKIGLDTASKSELLFVPKDSRGPRTIVREPMQTLSVQLAFFDWFSHYLEDKTNRRVNFQDQQVNRDLARIGSLTGEWCTLDLKEASDRVPTKVVLELCRNLPTLMFFLKRRTRHCVLPSGKTIKLNKLAGMGSGLTFAMMAFLIHVSITTELVGTTRLSYNQASRLVYVYGDDIIVPTWASRAAKVALDRIGLVVNTSKSYTTGPFRESCGGDYFHGEDVGPVRLRIPPGVKPSGAGFVVDSDEGLYALDRHARECAKAGMLNLADHYYSLLEGIFGPLPYSTGESQPMSRYTPYTSRCSTSVRRSGQYCRQELIIPVPIRRSDESLDPYFFVGPKLKPRKTGPLDFLEPSAPPVGGLSVTLPRSFKLRRRKRSSLVLVGK